MENQAMFLDCPAYLDDERSARCELPAEVVYRYCAESTGAPLESAKIRCPRGHCFNGPIELLTWGKHPAPARDGEARPWRSEEGQRAGRLPA